MRIKEDFATEIPEVYQPKIHSGIGHATSLNDIPDPTTTKVIVLVMKLRKRIN
jgi:hypothetical protein